MKSPISLSHLFLFSLGVSDEVEIEIVDFKKCGALAATDWSIYNSSLRRMTHAESDRA